MSVSIVIPTLNRWPFLDECLTSVAAQTDTNWEAVVVNDCSDEPDTEGIRQKWSDERFRWIDLNPRGGLSAARNAGFKAARHPLIFTLDNDDMLFPQTLERLRPLLDDPAIDCAYGDWEIFGSEARIQPFEELELSQLAVWQFIPAQVLMRKALWEKAGGYSDEPCFLDGNEDWDLWLSAAKCGFRYRHVPEPLYRYRIHPGGISRTRLARQDYQTREVMYRRHREFIDRYGSREAFLGQGYWRSAGAYSKRGTILKSFSLGLRAFTLTPNFPYARDLIRRNLTHAFGIPARQS